MDNSLSDISIQSVKGIGPQRAGLFGRIGIKTISDALYYLPCRYEDRSSIKNICDIREQCRETVRGSIISAAFRRMKGKRINIFELSINDGTGILKGKWFNQPFIKKNFRIGEEVVLSGYVKRNNYPGGGLEIENPEYEIVAADDDAFLHTNRVVPMYPLTEGISQKQFRKIMHGIVTAHIQYVEDPIPSEIIRRNNLPDLRDSLMQLHFPDGPADIELLNSFMSDFHRRLSFDELFMFEMGIEAVRKNRKIEKGISFNPAGRLGKRLACGMSFELTGSQKKVIAEIEQDMRSPYPMNRLLQGDVGCGKTIVAVMSMLNAVECGYQAAMIAPTEILAEQHYLNVRSMTEGLGVRSMLLVGGAGYGEIEGIASGGINIIVGTHALIQERVAFSNLGLVVIDEQHKFGVLQRALLRKKGLNPDVLVMTATPIPRSLALTLYGDLDYSVIDEMPSGRKPVLTRIFSPDQKPEIYRVLGEEIVNGRQAYVVYPAIEESETGLRNAVQGKEAFQRVFPEFRFGLLHGRMSSAEKESVMNLFKNGEMDVLISTTVIEVGVDVPNATVMLVVHAERFGLAQLHQLRGRVGRGAEVSYCLLVAYGPLGDDAGRRLDILVESTDGFIIAQEDLAIRGPGEFFGTRQAGMPDLKIADIIRDAELLEAAKREAFNLLESSPDLKEFSSLKKSVEVFWKGKVDVYKTA